MDPRRLVVGRGREPAAPPRQEVLQRLLADGYRLKSAGDLAGALAAFEQAHGLGAETQRIALEMGYLHSARGDVEAASRSFTEASQGPDARMAEQARRELSVLPGHFGADLYVETLGWNRTSGEGLPVDLVPTIRGRVFARPFLNTDMDFYLFTQVTRDLASRGQGPRSVPEIYADNYALTGVGVLTRFWSRRAGLFVQAGPAINLLDDGRERVTFDARAGLFLGLETAGCRPQQTSGVRLSFEPCADVYGESVYISRFDHNVVGLLRGRAALSYLHTGPLLWQGLLEGRAAADRLGHYYNNLADAGVGHRWRLLAPISLDLQLAFHAGSFLGRHHLDPLPSELRYTDLRLQAATYIEF